MFRGYEAAHQPERKGTEKVKARAKKFNEQQEAAAAVLNVMPAEDYQGLNLKAYVTKSGMCNEEFLIRTWIPFFAKEARRVLPESYGPNCPLVLVLDSHPAHKMESVKQCMAQHGIHPIFVPPNATANLQLLDVYFFARFKQVMTTLAQLVHANLTKQAHGKPLRLGVRALRRQTLNLINAAYMRCQPQPSVLDLQMRKCLLTGDTVVMAQRLIEMGVAEQQVQEALSAKMLEFLATQVTDKVRAEKQEQARKQLHEPEAHALVQERVLDVLSDIRAASNRGVDMKAGAIDMVETAKDIAAETRRDNFMFPNRNVVKEAALEKAQDGQPLMDQFVVKKKDVKEEKTAVDNSQWGMLMKDLQQDQRLQHELTHVVPFGETKAVEVDIQLVKQFFEQTVATPFLGRAAPDHRREAARSAARLAMEFVTKMTDEQRMADAQKRLDEKNQKKNQELRVKLEDKARQIMSEQDRNPEQLLTALRSLQQENMLNSTVIYFGMMYMCHMYLKTAASNASSTSFFATNTKKGAAAPAVLDARKSPNYCTVVTSDRKGGLFKADKLQKFTTVAAALNYNIVSKTSSTVSPHWALAIYYTKEKRLDVFDALDPSLEEFTSTNVFDKTVAVNDFLRRLDVGDDEVEIQYVKFEACVEEAVKRLPEKTNNCGLALLIQFANWRGFLRAGEVASKLITRETLSNLLLMPEEASVMLSGQPFCFSSVIMPPQAGAAAAADHGPRRARNIDDPFAGKDAAE
jgi:hypothetical protein